MSKTVSILITFITSFIISAGGAYVTGATGNNPITYTMISVAAVTGLVAGAQAIQKLMEPPPQGEPSHENPPERPPGPRLAP